STTTINWLIGSTVSAVGVGFLAFISQAMGAKEKEKSKKAVSQAVLAVLVCGVFFTALTLSLSGIVPSLMQVESDIRPLAAKYFFILYLPMLPRTATIIFGTVLRAAGDTKTPMRVGVLMNIINVVLNFFFIYKTRTVELFSVKMVIPGAGWGVVGAAIASAVAFTAGGILVTAALWHHPVISPKGMPLRPDKNILMPCIKVAIPNALQRFGTSLGYVAFAAMINSLGEISTAAHTIANTVESAFYIPAYGMQTAAATLAGNCFGAKDGQKLKRLGRTMLFIEVALMILSGGALFAAAPDMMRLFSKDEQVILLGTTVLRLVALSEPFYGVSIILEGMMQGMGKTMMPFVTNIIGMWCVRIVGTFICTQIYSLDLISAWGCMITHNMALFVVFSVFYLSGRWNPLRKQE
ncbi:MAG: MATE family efflux transporter, partial [Oscillospiraceae bacterium]|nr:MATE family efflux transporter [Oscillospiraceae bacterium]